MSKYRIPNTWKAFLLEINYFVLDLTFGFHQEIPFSLSLDLSKKIHAYQIETNNKGRSCVDQSIYYILIYLMGKNYCDY